MIMDKNLEFGNLRQFGIYLQENPAAVDFFRVRASFIRNVRSFMSNIGAIELEMPCLQVYREGAPVQQFVTTHPITGEKFYLRHCMEDHLRRLCDSFGQLYELGKAFRVEIEDSKKANEFTVLQYVGKDVGYERGLSTVMRLVQESISTTFSSQEALDLVFDQIQMVTFDELMQRTLGFGINDENFRGKSSEALGSYGSVVSESLLDWEVYEELLKYVLEPSLIQPTIIYNYPPALQHVAKIDAATGVAQRFSLIMNGIEVCDGGVKFNTSSKYREVYEKNATYRTVHFEIGDNDLPDEFFTDIDYRSSEVFTFGLGIDRILSVCTNKSIHEVQLHPFH